MKKLKIVDTLRGLKFGKLYEATEGEPDKGNLSTLVQAWRDAIGILPAESFCERFYFGCQLVMAEDHGLCMGWSSCTRTKSFIDWALPARGRRPHLR